MKMYARIDAGVVAELLRTEADPAKLFHPSLRWVVTTDPAIAVGWVAKADTFVPPPMPEAPAASAPTLMQLHARILELEAQVAALAH